MEIQKREQLKGLLVNKFKLKYGNRGNLPKFIDNEVHKFLTNDRLTEANLKILDAKISREADQRDKKEQILSDRKSQRSQSQAHGDTRSRHSRGGLSAAALHQLNRDADRKSQADARSMRSRSSHMSAVSRPKKLDAISVASSKKQRSEVFSEINENDEWAAIQKFNIMLHYEEQK